LKELSESYHYRKKLDAIECNETDLKLMKAWELETRVEILEEGARFFMC